MVVAPSLSWQNIIVNDMKWLLSSLFPGLQLLLCLLGRERQRGCQRIYGDYRLSSHGHKIAVQFHHRVLQATNALYFHYHHIANLNPARMGRRSRQDHISWLQRHQVREVGDLIGKRKHQVVLCIPLLYEFPIDVGAQDEIVRIDIVRINEHGAKRDEAILSFHTQKGAAISMEKVMNAPIVGEGIASNVVQIILHSQARATFADDHCKLTFVVEKMAATRPSDRSAVGGQ